MASLSSLIALFLFFLHFTSAAEQKCYGLNGAELDKTFGSCNPTAKHSGCCAIHRTNGAPDICLDNGLCMATTNEYMGTIWQNGCTDPTGKDIACPRQCPDVTKDFGGLDPVPAWNIQTCDYGSYCCRSPTDRTNCCTNASAPKFKTNSLGALKFPSALAAASTANFPVATSSSPSTSTDATLALGTAFSTGEPFSQSTATPIPRPNICPKDKSAVVGGAVGGTLGAMVLGLVGCIVWMWKRERRQRRLKEHYEEQFGQNWAYRRTIVVEKEKEVESLPGTLVEKGGDADGVSLGGSTRLGDR